METRWAFACLLVAATGCFESYAQPGVCSLGQKRDCTCDDGGPGWETCYNVKPAVWGSCACDVAPIANAGANRNLSYRTTVMLDGTASLDEDGPAMTFLWNVESVAPGSTATLDDVTSARPTFMADLPGPYMFRLTVDDTIKSSMPAFVTITAKDDAPIAVAAHSTNVVTGTPVPLDGSASSDPNGDPITYAWSVTARPTGSVAMPGSLTSATTSFTPDVDGAYELTLVVDDGRITSAPSKITIGSFHKITGLGFKPKYAQYSRALDRIVMVGSAPNSIYVYNPATEAITTTALAAIPYALSLSPDGLRAVVGHIGSISVVNLQTGRVLSQFVTGVTPFDVVHGGNGYAYVFPDIAGAKVEIRNVRLSDGVVTVSTRNTFNMKAKLLSNSTTIYGGHTYVPDLAMENISIATGTTATTVGACPYTQYRTCGELWTTDDSQNILTSCGQMFTASSTPSLDMQYVTSLPGVFGVAALSQASTPSKVLVIPPTGGTDDVLVRFYTYPTLAFEQAVTLPSFVVAGNAYAGHGRFVFIRSDGLHYAAVVQADPSAGLANDYGVVSYAF